MLVADYIASLDLLMRYPPSSDVRAIVQAALHFRNPKVAGPPAAATKRAAFLPTQTVGGQPSVHQAPQSLQGPVAR